MKAFIQNDVKGLLNKQTIAYGTELFGYENTILDHVPKMSKTSGDIAYGNVGWIRGIAKVNELKLPLFGYVPDTLRNYAPAYRIANVSEAYRAFGKFIKPTPEKQKHFNGFVIKKENPYHNMLTLANYDDNVIIQEPVEYVSEWRIIVLDYEVMDARHYKGNFRLAPDWNLADEIASSYKDMGPAWSFDVGITKEGKTILIECHCMFSLGCYGTPPVFMAKALIQAWEYTWKQN
jgi:hypothetical protein